MGELLCCEEAQFLRVCVGSVLVGARITSAGSEACGFERGLCASYAGTSSLEEVCGQGDFDSPYQYPGRKVVSVGRSYRLGGVTD